MRMPLTLRQQGLLVVTLPFLLLLSRDLKRNARALGMVAAGVLLVRLNYGPRDGRWALPGGLVENDETIEDAARRETTEETGFTVGLDGLLATWMRPGFPILVVIYRAHITSGTLRVAPDEASEAAFFPKDKVPPLEDLAWPSTVHGLDAWRAYEPPRP